MNKEVAIVHANNDCIRAVEHMEDGDENSKIVWPEVANMTGGTLPGSIGRLMWIAHDTFTGCLLKNDGQFQPSKNDFNCLQRMRHQLQKELSISEMHMVIQRVRFMMENITQARGKSLNS